MNFSFRIFLLAAPLSFCLCAEPPAVAIQAYRPEIQSKLILRSSTTADGTLIQNQAPAHPEVTAYQISIPAGTETGWHIHPVPEYAYILSGELTLTYQNGIARLFKAGEAFAEAVNMPHNGCNTGSTEVRLMVFITGERGGTSTIRTPQK